MATSSFLERKVAEGNEHLREAEKCLKTSLFKWKADTDGAIAEYAKAATCFKNGNAIQLAKDAHIKAAELQRQVNSPFQAAKSYEQAGLLSKESKNFDEAFYLMDLAAKMFQEHGTPDTGALTLDKAAKMVEKDRPDMAIELYLKACNMCEIEDKISQCAEYTGKAARLMIRCHKYDDAVEALKKEIDFLLAAESYPYINKCVLGLVLVHLHREDHVAADLAYKTYLSTPEFGTSEEAVVIESLLSALDSRDGDALRTTLSLPLIKYLDNAFARLARDLKISSGGKSNIAEPGVDGSGSAGAEDFSDDLC